MPNRRQIVDDKDDWILVTEDQPDLVEEFWEGLCTIRSHYVGRSIDEVYRFVRDKMDCEAWMYRGKGFKLGMTMLFKNGTGRYRVANAWYTGDVPIETCINMWADKADRYCARHGVKEYDVRFPKDMLGQMGFVSWSKLVATVPQKYVRIRRDRNNAKEELVVLTKA